MGFNDTLEVLQQYEYKNFFFKSLIEQGKVVGKDIAQQIINDGRSISVEHFMFAWMDVKNKLSYL